MSFDTQKKIYMNNLYKPDKSRKGFVDKRIISLIDDINKSKNFFTTSSCSGRINLFTNNHSEKKYNASWLLVSHDPVDAKDMIAASRELPDALVILKYEPMIMHVCTRTLEDAQNLIFLAHNSGFKHSGILTTSKRFIVQIVGSERIDAPIANNKKMLVNDNYIEFVTNLCNEKMAIVHEKINKLHENFVNKFIKE